MSERNWERYPKVSIAGAAYNHAQFIVRAIESCLAQDYPNLEIVMIDDGSTDETPQLVEPYLDRIKYVRKENGGVISAVNRLYEESTGEFIAFCAGDDEVPPDRISKHVEHMLAHPEVGAVYGDMEVIDADSNIINPSWFSMAGFTPPSGHILSRLFRENCVAAGALTVRASVVPSFWPIPEDAAFEDWWMVTNIAAVSEMHYLPEVAYRYRYHGQNMYLGADGEQMLKQRRKEIKFRRTALTAPFAAEVDTESLVACYGRLEQAIADVSAASGETLSSIIAGDSEKSAAALGRSLAALSAGSYDQAVREAIFSLAWDPGNQPALEAIRDAKHLLDLRELGLGEPTKASVVIARASELLDHPELLRAFTARFGGADDITLAVHVLHEEVPALAELAEREGLASDEGIDILLIADINELRLVACATAALGTTWARIRSFSADEMDELAAVVAV